MDCTKIPFDQTGQFSHTFLDFVNQANALSGFYHRLPAWESFQDQFTEKAKETTPRQDLVNVLLAQYDHVENPPVDQIESLLSPTTFTVTTGHQLNIYGGPLYFIYKMITVINLAKELKAKHPKHHFIPVYWMASEDHDFEEISHVHVFGTKHVWSAEDIGGPVGRMKTEGLSELFATVDGIPQFMTDAYDQAENLSDATRAFIHHLFGSSGLVCLDADDAQLKKHFAPFVQRELEDGFSAKCVRKTDCELESAGYKPQIHTRDINLFYMEDGTRNRIVRDDNGGYKVLGADLRFTSSEMMALLEASPEKFSPNVVLRPLYQEVILPNLSYTGGPAEVVYWLQIKGVFEETGIPYPILIPRNFALVTNGSIAKKQAKLGLSDHDLFRSVSDLQQAYLQAQGSEVTLGAERELLVQLHTALDAQANQIDGSLKGWIGAEMSKVSKSLDNIEKRLGKASEQKHETTLGQLEKLKAKLFPNGTPQERIENFMTYYSTYEDFVESLLDCFDPLDMQMYILKV